MYSDFRTLYSCKENIKKISHVLYITQHGRKFCHQNTVCLYNKIWREYVAYITQGEETHSVSSRMSFNGSFFPDCFIIIIYVFYMFF